MGEERRESSLHGEEIGGSQKFEEEKGAHWPVWVHAIFLSAVSLAPGTVPSTGLVLKASALNEYVNQQMNF